MPIKRKSRLKELQADIKDIEYELASYKIRYKDQDLELNRLKEKLNISVAMEKLRSDAAESYTAELKEDLITLRAQLDVAEATIEQLKKSKCAADTEELSGKVKKISSRSNNQKPGS